VAALRRPLGTRRDRYVVILVGAIAGYVVGRVLEDRMGWSGAMMVTTPVGGLLSGVVARFTLERFRD
jgi:uncharacterized membrane protein YeaQ/YmgE (transglycosylase-associated protein family)